MIHPYARVSALAALLLVALAAVTSTHILVLWSACIIAAALAGVMKECLLFHLTGILPIAVGLAFIRMAEAKFEGHLVSIVLTGQYPIAVSVGRIAVVGIALQIAILPLVRRDLLQDALWRMMLRGRSLALVTASVNAVRDLTKFARVSSEALKARGLLNRPFSGVRELPHILVSIYTHALYAALTREETWSHRSIQPELAVGLSTTAWSPLLSWLYTVLTVIFFVVFLWWMRHPLI
jgi:hypothetical protein